MPCLFLVCPENTIECQNGRVDGQGPPCISTEQRCNNVTDCIGGEDELDYNCPCGPEGTVRLVGGILPHRGRVELCTNGGWSTLCNNQWDRNDAAVVCRQLGYRSAGVKLKHSCLSWMNSYMYKSSNRSTGFKG